MDANVLLSQPTAQQLETLSALQLALAAYMFQGTVPPFFVNQDFLAAMKQYADTNCLSLMTTDYVTGQPRQPDINPTYSGLAFVSSGNNIYIMKLDDDPETPEPEYAFDLIGTRAQLAPNSWAYYGPSVVNGTVARGSGDWDNIYNEGSES